MSAWLFTIHALCSLFLSLREDEQAIYLIWIMFLVLYIESHLSNWALKIDIVLIQCHFLSESVINFSKLLFHCLYMIIGCQDFLFMIFFFFFFFEKYNTDVVMLYK